MRAKDFVTELFDKRYFKVSWYDKTDFEWSGGFTASDGSNITVEFEMRDPDENIWHLEWSREGSQDRISTDPKLATKILSTINAIVKQFVKQVDPFAMIVGVTNGDNKKIQIYHNMLHNLGYDWEKLTDPEQLKSYNLTPSNQWWIYYPNAEEFYENQPIKLRGFGPSEQTKEWVHQVKSKLYTEGEKSYIFWNHEGNLIPLGKEETKDIAAYVEFELVPRENNKVEVKWIQAMPTKGGYGAKGMKMLQDLAQQSGIALTLFPWDKGVVPQSKLIKFYKKQGFNPLNKSKNMIWEPK